MASKFLKNSGIAMVSFVTAMSFFTTKPSKVLAADENTSMPQLSYRAHVADNGWLDFVEAGQTAGTTGESRRMEALQINLTNAGNAKLTYSAHVADKGWMNSVEDLDNTETAGTVGQAKRMEAVKINVEGLEGYTIEYRAHVADIGWQNWVKAGEVAGTTGQAKQIEALEIRLVKLPEPIVDEEGDLTYRAHVSEEGWQGFKASPHTAGTTGKSLAMEALEINFNMPENAPEGAAIKYRVHLSNLAWQGWITADNEKGTGVAGTTGKSIPIEAVEIVPENLERYEIKYRAHVSGQGWQDWVIAKEGVFVGTTGKSLAIEAIEIQIIDKQALIDAKNAAEDELVNYINELLPNHQQNAQALEDELLKGFDAIKEATTPEEVQQALENAKAAMDAIESDEKIAEREAAEKALADAKIEAKKELNSYVIDKLNQNDELIDDILSTKNEWNNKIDQAESIEKLEQVLKDAKAAIDAIKTDEEKLVDAKAQGKSDVQTTMNDIISGYTKEEVNEIIQDIGPIIEEALEAIETAQTPEEVTAIVEESNKAMQDVKELYDAKKDALKSLNDYFDESMEKIDNDVSGQAFQDLAEALDNGQEKIKAAETVEDVETALQEAIDVMNTAVENA